MVSDTERVVAPAVERLRRHAAKVAHPRQRNRDQPVQELVHPPSAQRYSDADRHPGPQLVGRDRLLGLGDDRPLPRDRRKLLDGALEDLRVRHGLSHPHVQDDLVQARQRHDVVHAELLTQLGEDLALVTFFQSRNHFFFSSSFLRLPFQARAAPLFFAKRSGVPSASRRRPIRVRVLRSGSTSITLEMSIGASFSEIPPAMFFDGLGRTCRLIMLTRSTMTRSSVGRTLRTFPCRPLSRPVTTTTTSFFFSLGFFRPIRGPPERER